MSDKPAIITFFCVHCGNEMDRYFTEQDCACCGGQGFIEARLECSCLLIPPCDFFQEWVQITNSECDVHI